MPLAWPARLGSLGVEAFIDAARAAGPLLTTALAGLVLALATAAVPVSYTHLDVYKRQTLYCGITYISVVEPTGETNA